MLNKNTREILNSLTKINNSIIVSYPVTSVIFGKSIQSYLDLSKMDEQEFKEFGIYAYDKFNNILKIFKEPEINIKDNTLEIIEDKFSLNFATARVSLLENDCRGNYELINKIKKNKEVFNFKLTLEHFSKIKKVVSTLDSLEDFKMETNSENNSIKIKMFSLQSSIDSFEFDVNENLNIYENSSIILLIENLMKIPVGEYNIRIFKSEKGNYITLFESLEAPLEIIIAPKVL